MSQNHVDLIEFVASSLQTQGEKSMLMDGGDRCLYRLVKEDGTVLKCALGFLIPNSRYKTLMEDNDALDLFYKFPKALESTIKKFKLENESAEDLADFFNQNKKRLERAGIFKRVIRIFRKNKSSPLLYLWKS